MQRVSIVPVVLLAAAVAGASSASAAELRSDMGCYLSGQSVALTGADWTPGADWRVLDGEEPFAAGTVDAAGQAAATGRAPTLASRRRGTVPLALTATDGLLTSAMTVQVVNGGAIWSSSGPPRTKVRWAFGGLAPGAPIYVHVRRGNRTIKTTPIGIGRGPCGVTNKRLRRLPVPPAQVRDGNYRIHIDNRRRYAPAQEGRIQYSYDYWVKTNLRAR